MPNPCGRAGRTAFALSLACLPTGFALAQASPDTTGQADSVMVAPGPQYDTGWLHRLFFGDHYRDLWSTPIEAPVLDLASFAGGLKVTRRGGGEQTKSLRLEGADGKEYQFRSIDKDPVKALPPALQSTAAADIVRDQTSAGHPVGSLMVPPLLEAAGVLHAPPRIFQMPKNDPRLGQFAAEFGGMVGTIEERPNEEKGAAFAGATEIVSTDKVLKEVEDSPNDRVDAKAFLTARLVDILIGDWDRHADQWRWARFGDERPYLWRPIPRDRDQAFARYDGLLLAVARASTPQLVNFGPDYSGMLGQTWNGRDLDRRFLVSLEWKEWDSIATALQAKLTDQVIESAAAQLPPSYIPLDSARLAGALKQRRDELPEAAAKYYRHLAGEVDVHGTDRDEIADVHRVDGRFTEVSLAGVGEDGKADDPYFRRRFDHEETKEVRLMLHSGNDRVRVWGEGGGGVRVRVVPGKGTDVVVDSSRGGRVALYSEEQADSVLPGRDVAVKREPYAPRDTAARDWGDRWLSVTWLAAGPDIGIFAGTGVSFTRHGFRRDPFAERYRLRAGWSTGASTGRADFNATWIPENSRLRAQLLARASGIDVLRFHGLGNEISADEEDEFYRVEQIDLTLVPSLTFPVGAAGELTSGPQAPVFIHRFRRGPVPDPGHLWRREIRHPGCDRSAAPGSKGPAARDDACHDPDGRRRLLSGHPRCRGSLRGDACGGLHRALLIHPAAPARAGVPGRREAGLGAQLPIPGGCVYRRCVHRAAGPAEPLRRRGVGLRRDRAAALPHQVLLPRPGGPWRARPGRRWPGLSRR